MLNRICGFIHNYFTADDDGNTYHCENGTFEISGGSIELPFLANGQYFRIVGSRMNDGVYEYPAHDLAEETFTGKIYEMRVPRAVRKIAEEAEDLEAKYGAALNGPYTSESVIGVYSYTKAANATNGGDGWLFGKSGVFGSRLDQWRKLHDAY